MSHYQLYDAVRRNDMDGARKLLEHGRYDVNCIDHYGYTPLHIACKSGNVDMVRMLISEFKADMMPKNNWGNTPFHEAASHGQEKVALTLITEFGCDPNIKGKYGRTPLHGACREGVLAVAESLICNCKADINAQDDNKDTPLHIAAKYGKGNVALTLITEFGCDPTIRGQYGRTLLHSACWGGCITLAKLLIHNCNANINAQDENKDTPLHLAAQNTQHKLFLALTSEFSWDMTVRNKKGDKILEARHFGNEWNYTNGDTILHTACEAGNIQLVNDIYQHVSPLATNDHGETFLHKAAAMGHKECVETLLQLGAPIMLRNAEGETARDVAYGDTKLLLDTYISENQAKIYTRFRYNQIIQQAKRKYSKAECITRIFVIGHPGAGKSSFVETMKREGFFESFSRVSESSVPPHTAGIVPSIHTSKHYGRVLFYDFAGDPEYYSSHAAILENLASSNKGDNIFIIVNDLREDSLTIKKILQYWLSFVSYQHGMTKKKQLMFIGSHSDLLTNAIAEEKIKEISAFHSQQVDIECFTLNCCRPNSKQLKEIRGRIFDLTKGSPHYSLSEAASALLGLLEKDFSQVAACSAKTILSHIEATGIYLPKTISLLMPILEELHDLGLLFIIRERGGDSTQVILSISQLTNEVHKRLFSKEANKKFTDSHFNIGILPQSLLDKVLPKHITKECLVQLQYCQEISQHDVGAFPSLVQPDSSSQSFLFFPALCSVGKSEVSWVKPPGLNHSIGWLAQCAETSCDYFPPRFLHVLLLRLVFRFTLAVPAQHQTDTDASPDYSCLKRRCIMWNSGVHWSMEEGVECMVEMVNGNKGVVVITNSEEDVKENCARVFRRIISCVMEAKAEFCYSIRPQFFLLDPSRSPDYPYKGPLFAMSEAERVLASLDGKEVLSITDWKVCLKREKIACLHQFTLWNSLFSMDFSTVHNYLKNVVNELYELFIHLGLPKRCIDTIEADFNKVARRRAELVDAWISSSSPDPPCWWQLVQALKKVKYGRLSRDLETQYSVPIQLQKTLLDPEKQSLRPDEQFLELLAGVMMSGCPSLASILSLTSSELEEVEKNWKQLSWSEFYLQMLKKWATREEATYGQLCHKLRTIVLY